MYIQIQKHRIRKQQMLEEPLFPGRQKNPQRPKKDEVWS